MSILVKKQANTPFSLSDYADDAIVFFDFDGVLACQVEEKLFRLAADMGEREALETLAVKIGIDHGLYESTGYLRHLIYQALASQPVKRHWPAIQFAEYLNDVGRPFFIMTSRSGFWAVERMMDLIRDEALWPQEVFCLGRASKALLLKRLRDDWPDRPFVFIEDSQHHIDEAMALNDPALTIVQMLWDADTQEAKNLLASALRI